MQSSRKTSKQYPEGYTSLEDFVANAPLLAVFADDFQEDERDNSFLAQYVRENSESNIFTEGQAEEAKTPIPTETRTQASKIESEIEKVASEETQKKLKYQRRQQEKAAKKLKEAAKAAALTAFKQKEEAAKKWKEEAKKNATKSQKRKTTIADFKKLKAQKEVKENVKVDKQSTLKNLAAVSQEALDLTNQLFPMLALEEEVFESEVKKTLNKLPIKTDLLDPFLDNLRSMKQASHFQEEIIEKTRIITSLKKSPKWLDDSIIVERTDIHDIGIFSIFKKNRKKIDEFVDEVGKFIMSAFDDQKQMQACYCLMKMIDLLASVISNNNIDTAKVIQISGLIQRDIQQMASASLTPFIEMFTAIKTEITTAKSNAEKEQRIKLANTFMIRHYTTEAPYPSTLFSHSNSSTTPPHTEKPTSLGIKYR